MSVSQIESLAWVGMGVGLLLSGCATGQSRRAGSPSQPNRQLLDEVAAGKGWFHARKTRPIWAKRLEADQTLQTLEGAVQAHAGDCLCRGAAGELWPQQAKTLEERYVATPTVDQDGWRRYEPRPDAEGVLAAQVNHPFRVIATWGVLAGKAGDYVLRNYRDREAPYPVDVWVVDQKLFHATYQAVGD